MTTTPTERAERRQVALTREVIAAIVRAALDEALVVQRRQDSVQGYNVESWLVEITKRTTGHLDVLFYETLALKNKHAAWPAMVRIVEELHRPSSYVKDFYYHDREALEQKQPRVFAWATCDTGTWLFIPGTERDGTRAWSWHGRRWGVARSMTGTGGTAKRWRGSTPRLRWPAWSRRSAR